jgi:rSAM/selenodomain-associated transferase 1
MDSHAGRSFLAVGVMARAPSSPGKTRLASHLSEPQLHSLRSAMIADTLSVVASVPFADVFVFLTPDDGASELESLSSRPLRLIPQVAGDLGARMKAAFRHLMGDSAYRAAILVGSDIPLLDADHFVEARALLRSHGGVVLGPADDGGYYLIGMTEEHPALFEGISWGTDSVLIETLAASDRIGVETRLMRGTYDVDTSDDLRRLERDLRTLEQTCAPNVRCWMVENGFSTSS